MANTRVEGYVKAGFEKVRDVFQANLESGLEKGGNFAVYYQGELVVNIWGGYADEEAGRLWREDDLTATFSITKAVAAIVVAHLVDKGLLEYGEKVCKYWPEFAQNGKESVTLEQLLSHQAGVAGLESPFTLAMLRDNPRVLSTLLADQKPLWKLGDGFGYHPTTFGLYVDMIVRRVDWKWRGVADYFREEIAIPFDIDFHIGLPKRLHYRATREQLVTPFTFVKLLDSEEYKGDREIARIVVAKRPSDYTGVLRINDPSSREIQCPSTHGHGTAEAVAKLFSIVANKGTYKGKELLSREVIERFERPLVAGCCKTYGFDTMMSVGFMNTGVIEDGKPSVTIGHLGFGGKYAMADTKHGVGMAYITCHNRPEYGFNVQPQIFMSLYEAVYDAIFQIENKARSRNTFYFYTDFEKAGGNICLEKKN